MSFYVVFDLIVVSFGKQIYMVATTTSYPKYCEQVLVILIGLLACLIVPVAVVVSCLRIILSKCIGYAIICAAVIGMYMQEYFKQL